MTEYPESRPDTDEPLERFTFSLSSGRALAGEIDRKCKELEVRLQRLVESIDVKGVPLLGHILSLTRDPDELRRLAQFIERAAAILPELEDVKRRKTVLDVAINNPYWIAAAFGDFSADIDAITDDTILPQTGPPQAGSQESGQES